MFEDILVAIEDDTSKYVLKTEVKSDEELKREQVIDKKEMHTGDSKAKVKAPKKREVRVGRNDPCPCSSGKSKTVTAAKGVRCNGTIRYQELYRS